MYIAVTRPSDKLYISYYLSDENGKAVSPSPLVHFIKKVFPEKQGKNVYLDPPGVLPDDLDFVVPARAAGIAAREMAAIKQGECTGDTWYAVFKVLKEENVLTGAQVVFDSLEFTNKLDSLPRELAVNLYGKTMFTSVSKLERYKHCPFWHFAENGLRLKEREVYKLEPAQAGTFLHKALREYFEAVRKSGKDWHEFSVEDLTGIMEQVCRKLIPEVQNELLLSTSRYRFISSVLKSMLRKAVEVMSEHLKKGKFRPVSAEVLFGFPGGLPPLVVETASGEMVKLRGQIDRVDVALEGDKTYIRVIDYKSSDRRLDLASVYYGLSLQLLVYLLVVTSFGRDISGQLSQVIPAGAILNGQRSFSQKRYPT